MVVALMCARNEEWVLRLTLPAAAEVFDRVVVLDHCSTDRTPEIIGGAVEVFGEKIVPLRWDDEVWAEAAIRQRMLEAGREAGGDAFLVIDADEVVSRNQAERVKQSLAELEPGRGLELPWLAMWQSLDAFRHDDSVWTENFQTFGFRDGPGVDYRSDRDGYDLHMRVPKGLARPPARPIATALDGGLLHLQFANRRRLLAKHAWYKMTELVRFPGRDQVARIDAMYSQALDERRLGVRDADGSWWSGYRKDLVDLSIAPWHEAEVLRLWCEWGEAFFDGLELWGLPQQLGAESTRDEATDKAGEAA